jgi:nucleotide-binding universal stress UspA family protein
MKILVATDGSRAGLAALRFGTRLVGQNGAGELTVLTVYASPETGIAGVNGSDQRKQAEHVLAKAAREVSRRGSPPARFELVRARGTDEIPETISRTADRLQADLVVVGSEGRESLTEWVVGGTALRLIYVARRPVTVVRAPRRRASKRSAA